MSGFGAVRVGKGSSNPEESSELSALSVGHVTLAVIVLQDFPS